MEILEGLIALVVGMAKVVEFVVSPLCYWPGWLLLRLVTWGAYPPEGDDGDAVVACLVAGFVFWGLAVMVGAVVMAG
jgi:hypothetical protein